LPPSCHGFSGRRPAQEGRIAEHWVDYNLFGHQIVAHLSSRKSEDHFNPVDGDEVILRPQRLASPERNLEPH
jgi:extradiol dioxygenase family protein